MADLYVRKVAWTMAGAARPDCRDNTPARSSTRTDSPKSACSTQAWSELLTLEIGVDDDASVSPLESPYKPYVVFGSSATTALGQPPGRLPARMTKGRRHGVRQPGYSGSCKLQPDLPPETQIRDASCSTFSTCPALNMRIRSTVYATLVKAHPTNR